MNNHWDIIIVGLGGVGSAAAYHCAANGLRVLGIDQYAPVHNRGSSHGETRIIRQAYFEHPEYVPLLQRAYYLWDRLQDDNQSKLFHRSGIVQVGPEDGVVIPGVIQSANEYQLDVQQVSMDDISQRWPALRGHDGDVAVIESNAGYLMVESCVAAHLRMAHEHGAVCQHNETVVDWIQNGPGITVRTNCSTYHCDQLLVTTGAWSGSLLKKHGVNLRILRKYQYWFHSPSASFNASDDFPCFFFESQNDYYYGFPNLGDGTVKVARHSGGRELLTTSFPPDDSDKEDLEHVRAFNQRHLPALGAELKRTAGCYYTMSPDEHFIVDRLPDHANVFVVAGLSGHGFKFTSVLGEIAASMVANKDAKVSSELFRISRLMS